MAWALDFSTGDNSARVARSGDTATAGQGFIKFEVEFASFSTIQTLYWGVGAGTRVSLEVLSATQVRNRFNNDSQATTTLPFTLQPNVRYVFEVLSDGTTAELRIDGQLIRSANGTGNMFLFGRFGTNNSNANPFRGKLFWFEQTTSSEDVLRFENTTGSGGELTEQNFDADPMLLEGGWPTDDSQWVPVGEPSDDIDATIALAMPQFSAAVSAATTSPGVSASVAFTMPQFTALVDAAGIVPQYAASVALTMPQFTAAVTGEASAPTAGATVAFAMPQFIAAATADSLAPQYPASAAFTMPNFTAAVQAQAVAPGSGASVSFVMPQFTAAVTAETTVPEFPALAAFTMPQFGVVASAEASLPATGAVVSYTMPQFTVAASGESTVPTITADVAYTMPQFGVMVLTDETPLGIAPGARLAWVAGSNKLAYNVGSNRLSWRA